MKYTSEGFEVFGNPEGCPRISAVVPAPDINHISEEARKKTHQDAIDAVILNGYLITKCVRVRNEAFDKKGQKTTLSVSYRPCRNKSEIENVAESIRTILKRRASPP